MERYPSPDNPDIPRRRRAVPWCRLTSGRDPAMSRPGRARFSLALVVLAGTALLIHAGLQGTLSYYRTPTELAADPDDRTTRARLGGAVVPGSVRQDGDQIVFRLAADGHEITVRQTGVPPDTFRAGQDAVVEGVLGSDGVFYADQVLVKHGNDYRPPPPPPAKSGTAR
ncbi:cytochrome c maturation protein CcmE [Plantactinospora sp. KLBMP9567]|uniref:cytochrome c maturation protein CcmE n=1 Tax=Plantactinospora sp. KLBMP9567 TaxID=3085900 RepID=UPI002982535B|nr:cytochrome c maturation protein CcmE [Plantactinospora sp. KLBMP9567]MDW5329666.1 cytochrome c maturation protein CcmE [Plantactinospora sp. KLBMP9567]